MFWLYTNIRNFYFTSAETHTAFIDFILTRRARKTWRTISHSSHPENIHFSRDQKDEDTRVTCLAGGYVFRVGGKDGFLGAIV